MDSATPPRRYDLAELLAQCDIDVPISEDEREWMDLEPVGSEFW
jgi:antitoxin component of MazEF toxin-antitoxin module